VFWVTKLVQLLPHEGQSLSDTDDQQTEQNANSSHHESLDGIKCASFIPHSQCPPLLPSMFSLTLSHSGYNGVEKDDDAIRLFVGQVCREEME
jgi:hypothetical protein